MGENVSDLIQQGGYPHRVITVELRHLEAKRAPKPLLHFEITETAGAPFVNRKIHEPTRTRRALVTTTN